MSVTLARIKVTLGPLVVSERAISQSRFAG